LKNQLYLDKCVTFLKAFEISQRKMLKMDLQSSGSEFSNQIKDMHQFFEKATHDLKQYSYETARDKMLLTKQVERLIIFLKEMELHISEFHKETVSLEDNVLFIFERQHLFKNIYRKHLSDYDSIMK
jgi:hypothetical protein